eukprot:m.211620 g.211620  ORF g.211620 m.211620 type:complete len:447 (-) comp15066_c0_seq2:350-1690(-)
MGGPGSGRRYKRRHVEISQAQLPAKLRRYTECRARSLAYALSLVLSPTYPVHLGDNPVVGFDSDEGLTFASRCLILHHVSRTMIAEASLPPPKALQLEDVPSREFVLLFRVATLDHILQLVHALRLPDKFVTDHGYALSSVDALAILLSRLSYPRRGYEWRLALRTTWSVAKLSSCAVSLARFLCKKFGNALQMNRRLITDSFNQPELRCAIQNKVIAVPRTQRNARGRAQLIKQYKDAIVIIDGTHFRTAKPKTRAQSQYGVHQTVAFSGKDKEHCLKFHGAVLPNGLLASFYGAYPGRANDGRMICESRIKEHLMSLGAKALGDKGYGRHETLIIPFKKHGVLGIDERVFNTLHASIREPVKWVYGAKGFGIKSEFALLTNLDFMRIQATARSSYIYSAVLLFNLLTCLDHTFNKVAEYFDAPLPTLIQFADRYLHADMNDMAL